ncbi:MAG: hypothetical protein V1487_02205 [bacterium]
MRLIVRTDEKVLFEDEVEAVSSNNDVGVFDVLPQHIQFVTLVKEKIVAHRKNHDQEIMIEGGILKVKDNVVEVFVG